MRILFGPPPPDPSFDPQLPWRALREPRHIAAVIVLALPLGALAAVGYLVLALLLHPTGEFVLSFGQGAVVALLLFVPVHELLHAVAVPGSLGSPQLVVGVWPRAALVYVHYNGELGRARWLLVALLPLSAISLVTLILTQLVPPWEDFLLTFGVFNALGSGGDLLAAALVVAGVPRGARLRNQGWRTYWRPPGMESDSARCVQSASSSSAENL